MSALPVLKSKLPIAIGWGPMRAYSILVLWLLLPLAGRAEEAPPTFDDLLEAGQKWANENLDEEDLKAIESVDQDTVQQFFQNFLNWCQGDNVLDIEQLKPMAVAVLPLLEAHAETKPYAAWLKARLDYFQAAEELRAVAPPAKAEPEQPPKPWPNPPPEVVRNVWQKQLEKRPAPKRAEALIARLKPIFAAQHVPTALVYVAEVESAFEPNARSPSGAAGLFQIMPATAKGLGLSLRPVDQRLDPEKSDRAAARYLKSLHERFKDWQLALAAYNAGEGCVQKLLDKHGERTYDGIAVHLPPETQLYVPKINATLLRREGVKLADLRLP
jgi:membrane-bound lytic murein transglycosylase D